MYSRKFGITPRRLYFTLVLIHISCIMECKGLSEMTSILGNKRAFQVVIHFKLELIPRLIIQCSPRHYPEKPLSAVTNISEEGILKMS